MKPGTYWWTVTVQFLRAPGRAASGSLVPPTAHWGEEVTTQGDRGQGDREPRLIPASHCLNLEIRFSARVGCGPPSLLLSYLSPGLPETLLREQEKLRKPRSKVRKAVFTHSTPARCEWGPDLESAHLL